MTTIDSTAAVPSVSQAAESDRQNDPRQLSKPAANASGSTELSRAKIILFEALRHFPDFPVPGIDFIDILPLFADPAVHSVLIDALVLQLRDAFQTMPDVIVALDARGFLIGPGLALRLGVGFAPVRKLGKLPGPCETESFRKEYGEDFFQIQTDAVRPGQTALVVDDVLATGGSAQAAGCLVRRLGGKLLGYLFIHEIDVLKGRDKLTAPVSALLSSG